MDAGVRKGKGTFELILSGAKGIRMRKIHAMLRRAFWRGCKNNYHLAARDWDSAELLSEMGGVATFRYRITCIKCHAKGFEEDLEMI